MSVSFRWIRATHVCRYWRSAAIDCASLWTHLRYEDPPKLVEAMLKRSRGAPVDVLWRHHMISPSDHSSLAASLPQMNRIRSLKILSRDGGNPGTLLQLPGLPHWVEQASTLEELEIHIMRTGAGLRLPETFLQGGLPALSSLKVLGCVVGLNLLSCPTNLTVLNLRGRFAVPITARVFLATFGQMRLLRTLFLYKCLDFSPDIAANAPLFAFPSLRYLEVEDQTKNINRFLQLTRSDTATTVILNFLEPQAHIVDSSEQSLGNILTWWGYSTPATKLHVRHFNQGSSLQLEIDFDLDTGELGAGGDYALQGKNHLSIVFPAPFSLRKFLDILQERFDFRTLTSISDHEPPIDDWYSDTWSFFAGFPDLQKITLSRPVSGEIRDLFEALQGSDPLGTHQPMPFPSLSILNISCKFLDKTPASGGMTFRQFVTAFTVVAKHRKLSDCPISELHIKDLGIVEAAKVALLRERNPGLTVVWDGESLAE
ncbi:hypothetical protein FA13DRAFT_1726259 [Coprinellus micaceus]|uniref:F-box domain-containing protein n=1 Tax=Coprinellus micaceus TaxID=71717 RepID=A0A4Y7TU92_COPMI|nr:hypothetical protein FA13DRAFT_1726259 [Coprinellus micaceus]